MTIHSLQVLPPSDCWRLRFSVTADFCAPYKLLYYYYYYYYAIHPDLCLFLFLNVI